MFSLSPTQVFPHAAPPSYFIYLSYILQPASPIQTLQTLLVCQKPFHNENKKQQKNGLIGQLVMGAY